MLVRYLTLSFEAAPLASLYALAGLADGKGFGPAVDEGNSSNRRGNDGNGGDESSDYLRRFAQLEVPLLVVCAEGDDFVSSLDSRACYDASASADKGRSHKEPTHLHTSMCLCMRPLACLTASSFVCLRLCVCIFPFLVRSPVYVPVCVRVGVRAAELLVFPRHEVPHTATHTGPRATAAVANEGNDGHADAGAPICSFGHCDIIIGKRAPDAVWERVRAWLDARHRWPAP
jgi:hypothetical protein